MSWIQPISPDAAEGAAKEIIEDLRKARKPIPKMFLEMGRRPGILAGREMLRNSVHGGSSLGTRRAELLAYYVAAHGG
ncbi:MAG: hypothetical protein OXE44_00415 [Nitrospinae bacterium]|nr:hypothetical protein [Nitrospinota bacterium]